MIPHIRRNNKQPGSSPQNTRRLWLSIVSLALLASGVLVFFASPALAAEESLQSPSVPRQQFQMEAGFDSNRTLGDRMVMWGQYRVSWDDHWRLHSGLSYNTATGFVNALFVELGYDITREDTFGFRLKLLGNQYGEYGKAANSIIAYVNWDNSVYFIDFGLNYRFLNTNPGQLWNIFYYDNTSTESIYYYSLRRRFVMQDGRYRLDLEVNNHDPMYAGNLGAYGLFLKNRFTVNDKVAVLVTAGARQTGSIGLSATYYKTMIFWGVEVGL